MTRWLRNFLVRSNHQRGPQWDTWHTERSGRSIADVHSIVTMVTVIVTATMAAQDHAYAPKQMQNEQTLSNINRFLRSAFELSAVFNITSNGWWWRWCWIAGAGADVCCFSTIAAHIFLVLVLFVLLGNAATVFVSFSFWSMHSECSLFGTVQGNFVWITYRIVVVHRIASHQKMLINININITCPIRQCGPRRRNVVYFHVNIYNGQFTYSELLRKWVGICRKEISFFLLLHCRSTFF